MIPQPFRSWFLSLSLIGLTASLSASESQTFGQAGRDGIDGRSGRSGISAPEQRIRAGQTPQTIEVSGTDGESGESGTSGESAGQCYQPPGVERDLFGARGGNGGNGSNGGNGGNGGDTTLYFDQLTQLQTVVLRNRGGRGGVGGSGGQSGPGCRCSQPRWTVNYCTWALMSKPINSPDAPWQEVRRKTFRCSGDAFFDEQQNRPEPPRTDSNNRYGWKYISRDRRSSFQCEDGPTGKPGASGREGSAGRYGEVWLVQGNSIPVEQVSYRDRVSQLTGKRINLLKNNWLPKTGLRNLLAPGSDVPDSYRLLETVQGGFIVTWQTPKKTLELGDPEIEATISSNGKLQFNIPGTLESKLTQQTNQTIVTITGGIHPNRLGQFKFRGFDRFQDARNFTLLDEADLLPELRSMRLIISLSKNNSKLQEIAYSLRSNSSPSPGLTAWKNLYKVNLGDRFNPWLKPGERVQYDIQIEQTTKAGTTYRSGMKVNLVVDQVTPNPNVQYYVD